MVKEEGLAIRKPIFNKKNLHAEISFVLKDDTYFDNTFVHDAEMTSTEAIDIAIESSLLEGVDLSNSKLKGIKLVDVHIEKSNFSNSEWENGFLDRIEIVGSRLTGLKIIEGSFRDVYIRNSKIDLSLFRFSKFRNVCFENCVLTDSDFLEATLTHVKFAGCDLSKVEFSHATFERVDFSGSKIEGIKINPEQLRGIIIDASQVFAVAQLMGVVIK